MTMTMMDRETPLILTGICRSEDSKFLPQSFRDAKYLDKKLSLQDDNENLASITVDLFKRFI